jgi:hypothetical protein
VQKILVAGTTIGAEGPGWRRQQDDDHDREQGGPRRAPPRHLQALLATLQISACPLSPLLAQAVRVWFELLSRQWSHSLQQTGAEVTWIGPSGAPHRPATADRLNRWRRRQGGPLTALHCTALHCTALHCTALAGRCGSRSGLAG